MAVCLDYDYAAMILVALEALQCVELREGPFSEPLGRY